MNALAEAFADVFVEPDGGATMADVAIVIAGIAAVVMVCWWLRRRRTRVWAAKMAEAVETALASRELAMENREDIELLRHDEDKMALVVGGVLEQILGEITLERPRHLRAVP